MVENVANSDLTKSYAAVSFTHTDLFPQTNILLVKESELRAYQFVYSIYIYMYVCVCVCVCVLQYVSMHQAI